MKTLRIISIIGALLLMGGEVYRSWGAGRPVAFWMDDMLAGAMMIAAAIMMAHPTQARRNFLSAAWGVSVGMLYGSFFGKVFDPASTNSGNFSLGLLTVLVGVAFAISIAGLIASILLPDSESGS